MSDFLNNSNSIKLEFIFNMIRVKKKLYNTITINWNGRLDDAYYSNLGQI